MSTETNPQRPVSTTPPAGRDREGVQLPTGNLAAPATAPVRRDAAATERREAVTAERSETGERLGELRNNVQTRFADINDGVALPYNLVTKRNRRAPKVTFDDVKDAVAQGQWAKVVTSSFSLFFRGANEVEALGYFTQGVERLDTRKQLGVLRQMENADQKNMTAEQKLKTAILRTETDFLRAKAGLRLARKAETDGKPLKIGPNQRVRDLVKPEVLKDINDKKIAGALVTDDVLPAGAFLHCEKNTGYPLYVTETETGTVPAINLYEKNPDAVPKGRNDREKRIEHLVSGLKVGDVLFPNEPDGGKSMTSRYSVSMGRLVQAKTKDEEGFFAMHVMVYMGDRKVRHVGTKQGGEEMTIDHMFSTRGRNYDSVAVGRIGDQTKAAAFASKCEEFSKGVTSYSKREAVDTTRRIAANRIAEQRGGAVQPTATVNERKTSAICVDMVQYAANKADVAELKGALMPLDIFKAMKIEYAMSLAA
jgi:hypothetical protein